MYSTMDRTKNDENSLYGSAGGVGSDSPYMGTGVDAPGPGADEYQTKEMQARQIEEIRMKYPDIDISHYDVRTMSPNDMGRVLHEAETKANEVEAAKLQENMGKGLGLMAGVAALAGGAALLGGGNDGKEKNPNSPENAALDPQAAGMDTGATGSLSNIEKLAKENPVFAAYLDRASRDPQTAAIINNSPGGPQAIENLLTSGVRSDYMPSGMASFTPTLGLPDLNAGKERGLA